MKKGLCGINNLRLVLFLSSDFDRGVSLHSDRSLELVNRPRHSKGENKVKANDNERC